LKKSSLLTRLLVAMLALALLPLLISSAILAINLRETGTELAAKVGDSADLQASENLEMRARQVAGEVARYLAECEADLHLLARLPLTPETMQAFADSRRDEVWEPVPGMPPSRELHRASIHRYRTITLLDASGRSRFTVEQGKLLPPDSALPAARDVPADDYFERTRHLKPGEA
jgi:hypothetical protein